MMRHRGFFAVLWLLLAAPCLADDYESPEALKQLVLEALTAEYSERYSESQLKNQVEINVSNLDSRLRLAKCEDTPSTQIAVPQAFGSNVTVKVTCEGSNRWSIYVPARIDVFADVAVARRNLARGHVIHEDDVQFIRMNTSQNGSGHIEDMSRALGMELRRPLRSGELIRLSHLQATQIVKKGDRVQLEARSKSVTVVVGGRALSNGKLGEQIRVQNTSSEQIVDATVIGPGRVEVPL